MSVSKSDLIKQLQTNYPNILKKDLLKIFDTFLNEIKLALKNGERAKLPFSETEYNQRVNKLRSVMDNENIDMIILTSMHNIAYYTSFIYCSFGRPYGCVITKKKFRLFQQILMPVSLGEDHTVIMLFILIGKKIIF